jgi:hypothetical protein
VDERPALTKHQKVVADAVAAVLEPVLKEMSRNLDVIAEKLDASETALREVARRIDLAEGIDRHTRDNS